jgi:hypothetical protein
MVAAEVDAEVRLQPSPLKRGVVRDEVGVLLDRLPEDRVGDAIGVVNVDLLAVRELQEPQPALCGVESCGL